MATTILTQARLRELLHYDPDTGVFTWRVRRGCAQAGDIAGSLMANGYLHCAVDRRFYYCHRLAWLYVTGSWPQFMIDHMDRNKANNAFRNLRDVPLSVSQQNRSTALANSKTGLLGASPDQMGGFVARISNQHIGRYATAEAAHSAYLSAKRKLHPGYIP